MGNVSVFADVQYEMYHFPIESYFSSIFEISDDNTNFTFNFYSNSSGNYTFTLFVYNNSEWIVDKFIVENISLFSGPGDLSPVEIISDYEVSKTSTQIVWFEMVFYAAMKCRLLILYY